MIIYRFERDGAGPFFTYDSRPKLRRVNKKRMKKASHTQYSTRLRNVNRLKWIESGKVIFGCPSKELLRAYFGYNFKGLFEAGFRIKTYKVPDQEVLNFGYEVAFPIKYQTHKKSLTRKTVVV